MRFDLSPHIEQLARELLGAENRELSTRAKLLFGTRGSVSVEISGPKRGEWYDFQEEKGGGPWELISHKGKMSNGAALDWLNELGIEVPRSEFAGRIVATYDYTDERGTLLFQVVRLGAPKDFRQRRPLAGGGWDWKTKGVRRVLYELPALIATPISETVYIVEGEKDAETLGRLGLAATTNAGGASTKKGGRKWLPEFSAFFARRNVVVLPDNDDEGRAHMQAVAANVAATAAAVRIVELPGLRPKGDVSDWLAAGGTRAQLEALAQAVPLFDRAPSAEDPEQGATPLAIPLIRIIAGELPRVVDEAEAALIVARCGLYQRGGAVVRPVIMEIPTADGGTTRGHRLAAIRSPHIVECMTRAAQFERFDGRTEKFVLTDCPPRIAETYLARDGLWKLPVLAGVINAPTLRHDGSILEVPGYDPRTGLLFEPLGTAFPPVPEHPSRSDGLEALRRLSARVATFPFVGDADRSVAISGILTSIVRRSLTSAPLHAFTAPVAGSGKTLLVDLVSIIATGRPAGVIAQGQTIEELEKRLGAALLAGDVIINVDNCERPLEGDLLCQALTQQSLKIRVLGQSQNVETPANAAIFATGNNLVLGGDLTRRALLCSLDPQMERPELRAFDEDLIGAITAERGSYVVAALTVLRSYHVAGRPVHDVPLGGFVEWSRLVRNALIWLGGADPCATMEKTRDADPKLGALAAVLAQWDEVIGERRVLVKEIIERACEQDDMAHAGPRFLYLDFRDSLLTVAADGAMISNRRLGKWLSANAGRIVDRRRLIQDGTHAGVAYWRLEAPGSAP